MLFQPWALRCGCRWWNWSLLRGSSEEEAERKDGFGITMMSNRDGIPDADCWVGSE